MAWTLATLKQAVQDYVETDEVTFVANLDNIILMAEDRIIKDFVYLPALRKEIAGAMIAGDRFFSVPDDLLAVHNFAIVGDSLLESGAWQILMPKETGWIREVYPNPGSTGKPKYYAYFDDERFLLGPTPNLDYGVTLEYFAKPQSITVASSGTSWIGDHMEATLLAAVILEAYIYLKGDADLMGTYEARYKESLAADRKLIALTKVDEARRVN